VSPLAQDDRTAQRVGAIALLALAATIATFVFLLDRVALGSPIRVRVLFRHTAGLRERAAIVVAGQPVGRIESITPVPHGASPLLHGEVGVAVTIAVDAGDAAHIPARADIFVASRGPLADKYLEVAPPPGDPGPAVHDGQELRGVDPPTLDNVLAHTWNNLTTFQLFVATVRPELDALLRQTRELRRQLDAIAGSAPPGGVGALVRDARALAHSASHSYASALGGDAGLAQLRATISDARTTLDEIRAAVDLLGPRATAVLANVTRIRGHLTTSDPISRAAQAAAAIRAVLDKLDPLLATAAELGQRLARGEGSIGRLMTDPEFSDDAKAVGKYIKRHPWKILERPPR
jgi:ABC-type transporter Mla subunit MlaD